MVRGGGGLGGVVLTTMFWGRGMEGGGGQVPGHCVCCRAGGVSIQGLRVMRQECLWPTTAATDCCYCQ